MFHSDHRDKKFKVQPPIRTIALPSPVPSASQVEYQTQAPAKKGATWRRQQKQDFWPKAAVIALSLIFLSAVVWFFWRQNALPPSPTPYGEIDTSFIQFDDDAASNAKKDTAVGELSDRFVGVLNGSIDAIAEPEFVGQAERQVADFEPETLGPNPKQ